MAAPKIFLHPERASQGGSGNQPLPLPFSAHSNDALNLSISPREAKMEFPISASGGKNEINSGERARPRRPNAEWVDRRISTVSSFRGKPFFRPSDPAHNDRERSLSSRSLSPSKATATNDLLSRVSFFLFAGRPAVLCGVWGRRRRRTIATVGKRCAGKKVARSNLDI